MNKIISDNKLKEIAKIIKEKIFVARNNKVTVFLCGADITNKNTARSKMATIFSHHPRYELLYPEDLFDDLLVGQKKYSLLALENILADNVDAIVLFPESPGSFAEIGAFSNNEKLVKKLIVLSDKKYKSDKSFIRYGPYRLIKNSSTGKVIDINYNHLSDSLESTKIYRKVNDFITKIKKANPVDRDVANILEAENFILPCIYLFDKTNTQVLCKLISFATGQEKILCDIATSSSLGRLASKSYISKSANGFQITKEGVEYMRNTFKSSYLDKVRLELLNAQNRRNASVSCDRISGGNTLSK